MSIAMTEASRPSAGSPASGADDARWDAVPNHRDNGDRRKLASATFAIVFDDAARTRESLFAAICCKA
jgi:hypothetical protein